MLSHNSKPLFMITSSIAKKVNALVAIVRVALTIFSL
nr:MAG TPA: hypothetical protein [Caudoviricetes sp.]